MNTDYWTTVRRDEIIDYLLAKTRLPALPLNLPTQGQINSLNLPPLSADQTTAIDGLALAAANLGGDRYLRIGRRLHIRDYQGPEVGEDALCPFPRFVDCVLRDLRLIAATVLGRRLLHSLDNNGGACTVKISFAHGITPNSSQCNGAGQPLVAGVPGRPASSEVVYNPLWLGLPNIQNLNDRDVEVQPGEWGYPSEKPADVTLFHELIHADDMLRGIFDDTEIQRGSRKVKISEFRCVGLDAFDNSSMMTENNYRAERGVAHRPFYAEVGEINKAGPAVTPAYTALANHLDCSIMSKTSFIAATKRKFGSRNKIREVEQALVDYNRNHSWREDPVDRVAGLEKLMHDVVAYKEKSKAKRDVSDLVDAVAAEVKTIVEALLGQPASPDNFKTLRGVGLALSRLIEHSAGKKVRLSQNNAAHFDFTDHTGTAQHGFNPVGMLQGYHNAHLTPPQIALMQAQDLAELQQLSVDPNTAPLTRNIIAEMLVLANAGDVNVVDTTAGSSAGRDPAGGYRVVYGQWNYDDLRHGTLIHELTHVANMKIYDATLMMLSYDVATPIAQVQTLLATRKRNIERLIALAEDAATGLSAYQKHWLIDPADGKLPYAIATPPPNLLDSLKNAPNGSQQLYDDHVNLLMNGQLTQVTHEYETVINQSLVYMRMWDIPTTNPFHARALQLAQAAYDERVRLRPVAPVAAPVAFGPAPAPAPVVAPAPAPATAPAPARRRAKSDGDLFRRGGSGKKGNPLL